VAWYDRLLGRVPFIADWGVLRSGRVEVEGIVEAVEALVDPIQGDACVAVEYRAWPPSTTLGMDGAATVGGRAFQIEAGQAVEFALRQGARQILVRPDTGQDVAALHRDLLRRYGVNLRADVHIVVPGARLRVVGHLEEGPATGSPMRADPFTAVLTAERMRIV
jgi:hypothetical protein